MNNHLSVFRNKSGEVQVLKAYDSIMDSWPVPYEDLFISTRLGKTHVISSGSEDAPPIILIHAFYASAASWFQNAGSLSKSYRVYAVDIIGDPNKSQPLKPIRQLADFVDWFNDVMNELHLDQADFIGNSVGAFHIMNFALSAPQRVRRMILIGPAATFLKITPFYIHTFPGGMTGWTFLVRHAIRWIENGVPLNSKFYKLFYLIMKYGKSANQVFPAVFTDEQLKKITTPTLLIYGEKEVIYDYKLAINRAEQYIQNIKTEIIPQGNHLTAVSQPDFTNRAILNFLNGTG
jgi:pimeloyl-ACP methyl ester carboxylesterase